MERYSFSSKIVSVKMIENYSITELQEHLDKYSLEAKEVEWIYIEFDENVQYKEIEHTLDLLKEDSTVIRASPDLLEG